MTIQVELSPELEARLAAEAAVRGMALEEYAIKILEDNMPLHAAEADALTDEVIEEMTRELTRGSENLPVLPPEATDRESFYEGR
jgi:predicted dinucleotide-utilizing enzyme